MRRGKLLAFACIPGFAPPASMVGGDRLPGSAQAHVDLVAHLATRPRAWVAPFQEVMDYVFSHNR